jgi:murein DD-endopeptidase MepM/ murein hydrolase activator NlpD
MRRLVLAALVVLALLAGGAAYWLLARSPAPTLVIEQPDRALGARGALDVVVAIPDGRLSRFDAALEQDGRRVVLATLDRPADLVIRQEAAHQVRLMRSLDRRALSGIRNGPARLVVVAARRGPFGWRERETRVERDLVVRLDPPRIGVVSTLHYINHGGSELVVYRVSPDAIVSGVQVGDLFYPGFPAAGAGVEGADPALRVAFFAVRFDQDLAVRPLLFARDEAGNEARAAFAHRIFPTAFRRTRIDLDEAFMTRVVTEVTTRSPEARALVDEVGDADLLARFLKINSDLRQRNTQTLAALARETAPQMLWRGSFLPLAGSQVESRFADYRTYYYRGREVDRQVHLGFDLAATANAPVRAANRGRVVWADYLGIYGNTVVLDHGLGVQSLYGHLASIQVRAGDLVERGDELGRTGMTGLAGGDHLHFTMLVGGHPVDPVEWWDPHWIEDRIVRKLEQAGSAAQPGRRVYTPR